MSYRSRAVSPPKTRFLLNEGCIGYANDFDCTPVPYTSAAQPIAKVEGVVKHYVSSNRDLQNMNLGSCYQSKRITDGRPFLNGLHEDGESPMMSFDMNNRTVRSQYKQQINQYLYKLKAVEEGTNTSHVHDVFRYIDSSLIPCKNVTDQGFLIAYKIAFETRKIASQALLSEWEKCITGGTPGILSSTAMLLWKSAVEAYQKLEPYGKKDSYHAWIDNTRREKEALTEQYKKYLYEAMHHGKILGTEESGEAREFNVFSSLDWLHSVDKNDTHKDTIDNAQDAMKRAEESIVSDFNWQRELSDTSKRLFGEAKQMYEAILHSMDKEKFYSRIRIGKNSMQTTIHEINTLIRKREGKSITMQGVYEDKMYDVFRGVSKNKKARLNLSEEGAARLQETMNVVFSARKLLIDSYLKNKVVSDDSYRAYQKAGESYKSLMVYVTELNKPPAKKATRSNGPIEENSMLNRSGVSLGSQQVCVCAHPVVCNLPMGSTMGRRPVRTF